MNESKLNQGIECPQCRRVFKNDAALRMHKIRKHSGRGWNSSGNFRPKPKSRAQRLAERREYQRRLRERYYREGKDAKGQPRPPGWQPRPRILPSGSEDERAKHRAYQRQWYAKRKAARTMHVYPVPAEQPALLGGPTRHIKFCPQCGENLQQYES
jgi:hypothetical protein